MPEKGCYQTKLSFRVGRLMWEWLFTSWYYHRKDTKHTSYFNQIFALLFADDTVILSESLEGMQKAFDNFQEYCNWWKLPVSVNSSKT